ncbi:hypothetical protein VTI74DRAFT_6830 [Chaetomium olivicolor]
MVATQKRFDSLEILFPSPSTCLTCSLPLPSPEKLNHPHLLSPEVTGNNCSRVSTLSTSKITAWTAARRGYHSLVSPEEIIGQASEPLRDDSLFDDENQASSSSAVDSIDCTLNYYRNDSAIDLSRFLYSAIRCLLHLNNGSPHTGYLIN